MVRLQHIHLKTCPVDDANRVVCFWFDRCVDPCRGKTTDERGKLVGEGRVEDTERVGLPVLARQIVLGR